MRPADTWKDYELLDATGGNRLERWGETLLVRPDPQVVWKTPQQSPLWAKADAIYHRSNQGGGEWEYRRRLPEKWKISCGEEEDKLTLIVSPTGFKHTGVFPEQAVNWAWYAQKIRAAGRPVKVLNLFGYTGGATLACAAAGATVCHVDASKGIVAWGKDNAAASVSRPTGPPLYISMMARRRLRSSSSRPSASTSIRFRLIRETSRSMMPSPSTVAKSRTRLRKRLATRGVPRLHLASS